VSASLKPANERLDLAIDVVQHFPDRIKPCRGVLHSRLQPFLAPHRLPEVRTVHALLSEDRAQQGVESFQSRIILAGPRFPSILRAGWSRRLSQLYRAASASPAGRPWSPGDSHIARAVPDAPGSLEGPQSCPVLSRDCHEISRLRYSAGPAFHGSLNARGSELRTISLNAKRKLVASRNAPGYRS
jgi:hypothetical protein